ncbi:MAG: hypothetical protein IPL78_18800 [Chloroflexi bacterium]|nr:hypothetical protein [Chloroflexota bacterium]
MLANQIARRPVPAVADVYLGRPTSFAAAYRVTPFIGNIFCYPYRHLLVGIGLLVSIPWVGQRACTMFFGGAIVPMVGTVIVLENKAGFDALRRGWDLTRRRFWPVVGYVVILGILVTVITIGPSTLLTYLTGFVWSGYDPASPLSPTNMPGQAPLWATVLQTVITVGLQTLILPIQLGGGVRSLL